MDMRKRLGEILDAASAGERILIERDHRPLAYLISVEDAARLDPDRDELLARRIAAMDRLMALGERDARDAPGSRRWPDGEIFEWIREDRSPLRSDPANARRGESGIAEE